MTTDTPPPARDWADEEAERLLRELNDQGDHFFPGERRKHLAASLRRARAAGLRGAAERIQELRPVVRGVDLPFPEKCKRIQDIQVVNDAYAGKLRGMADDLDRAAGE